jgi:hypothetical protein
MTVFLGCDPGKSGALAVIDHPGGRVIDMPENPSDLYEHLYIVKSNSDLSKDNCFCILESAQVLPKQGIKGAFTYGIGYGKIKACLDILEIPYQEIHPAKWKKEFSLINKGKDASVKAAQQLFPSIEFFTPRGRMLDGRAEAILMADYGRRIYAKTQN